MRRSPARRICLIASAIHLLESTSAEILWMRISYSQFVPIDGESYRQKELGSESLTYSNPRATQSIRDQLRRQTRPPALSREPGNCQYRKPRSSNDRFVRSGGGVYSRPGSAARSFSMWPRKAFDSRGCLRRKRLYSHLIKTATPAATTTNKAATTA